MIILALLWKFLVPISLKIIPYTWIIVEQFETSLSLTELGVHIVRWCVYNHGTWWKIVSSCHTIDSWHIWRRKGASVPTKGILESKRLISFCQQVSPFYESLLAGTKKALFEKQHRSPLPSYDHPVLSSLNFNPGFFFFSSKAFSRIIFSSFLRAPK